MLFLTIVFFLLTEPTAIEVQGSVNKDDYFILKPDLPADTELEKSIEMMRINPSNTNRLKLASLYLKGSKMPGFGDWFHYGEALLAQYDTEYGLDISYLLLLSDMKQQQHQFEQALQVLNKIFKQQPQHAQASLIAARIYLAVDNTKLAQNACNRLMTRDIFLFSVCSFEVLGRKGEWQQAYNSLFDLYSKHFELDTELVIWIQGILAEQAEQLGYLDTALEWLTPILDQAPTSLWLKWADLSLKNDNALHVYEKLTNLALVDSLEDSLMLRLAIAEQHLKRPAHFQTIIHERMALRLIREDEDHAADMVHYFLTLKPEAQLALKWAKINYKSAKEPDDKKLLQLSQQALLAMAEEKP